MYSCANGHHTSVRMLVKAGAAPGRTNQRGETGLHLAAKNGSRGCVKELLAANCAVNVVDGRGLTPLLLAAINNRVRRRQLCDCYTIRFMVVRSLYVIYFCNESRYEIDA